MSNPFSDIIKEAKGLFGKENASESVVGIDVGSSSVKVVQIKKKGGKAILETYGTLALGPYQNQPVGVVTNLPTASIAQAILDIIKEAGVTVSDGGIAIPSSSSLLFTLELPGTIQEKDLPNIIPTEARKYIPVPITEVLLDYWVIPKQEESVFDKKTDIQTNGVKNEVLAVAIHNDTIAQYKEIMVQSKIINPIFELEIFSAMRSVLSNDLSPTLFIDFGASRTKLSIIEYGIVRNFHVISRGSADITRALAQSLSIPFETAEELKRTHGLIPNATENHIDEIIKLSVNYIFSETSSVIFNYEKKTGKTISKIILSGGGSLLKGFFEEATQYFSTEVVLANPFIKVEAPAFLSPTLKDIGPEFSVALGVALRKLQ